MGTNQTRHRQHSFEPEGEDEQEEEEEGEGKSKPSDGRNAMMDLKKMGWYWGSISPEYAARLLENEPDGSFLLRDSKSDCHIFSMTFKLEGYVYHTRIERSKGKFSFGHKNPTFTCSTIVDFIEQAMENSQNGDMMFFLHREPVSEGPVRFRMVPFSRLNLNSSLKHMCRFAILPYVKRDKIEQLSIPKSLREYLSEPFVSYQPSMRLLAS